MPLQDDGRHAHTVRRRLILQAEKNDSRMPLTTAKDEFPEILVVGDNDPIFLLRQSQDIHVIGRRHRLRDHNNITVGITQAVGNRCASRFVYDEAEHWAS